MRLITHRFANFVGGTIDDGYALALRGEVDLEFRPDTSESWVIRCGAGGRVEPIRRLRDTVRGMWLSPTRRLYVAELGGIVHVSDAAPERGAAWTRHDLRMVCEGVWGLADDQVYAWGMAGRRPVVQRWDGRAWHVHTAPGRLFALHGTRDDLLYGVGWGGLTARWDGSAWRVVDASTREVLGRVLIAADDEIYASGHGPWILEGSVFGWSYVAWEGPRVGGLAVHAGRLWLAASTGLAVLARNRPDVVNPKLRPIELATGDARLIVTCEALIAETVDGEALRSVGLAAVVAALRASRPSWIAGDSEEAWHELEP